MRRRNTPAPKKDNNEEEEEIGDDEESIEKQFNPIPKDKKKAALLDIDNPAYAAKLKEQKKKKQKSIREQIFLQLKRKRVTKKTITPIQSVINQCIKKKATEPEDIARVMNEAGLKRNESVVNIVKLVQSSKVVNARINLTDRISDQPLFTYYSTYAAQIKCLTNDVLYLWYIYSYDIEKSAKNVEENITQNKFYLQFMRDKCTLENVQIVSSPMIIDGKIKKGYYQDYSGDFLALNLDNQTEEERNAILSFEKNNKNRYKFTYQGVEYAVQGTRKACVIFDTDDKDELINMYKSMEILHVEDNKIELKEKTIDVEGLPKFLNCTLKGERFCPCYMIFPKEIEIAALYKIKLDNNQVFDILDQQLKENKNFEYPENMCYWTDLDGFIDFMWVYSLTSKTLAEEENKKLKEDMLTLLTDSIKYKPALNAWKSLQLEYQRLLYDYFNSFNSRIKYDHLMNIYNKIQSNYSVRTMLKEDESYKFIVNFFKFFGNMAKYINNQFKEECMSAARSVIAALSGLENGELENLEEIKDTAIHIFYLADIPDNYEHRLPSFPFVLSPGAFLGNVISEGVDTMGDDMFDKLMAKYKRAIKKVRNEYEKELESVLPLIQDDSKQIIDLIKKATKSYLQYAYIDTPKPTIKKIVESVTRKVLQTRNVLDIAKREVAMETLNIRKLKEDKLDENKDFQNIIETIVETFGLNNDVKLAELKVKQAKINKELKNLQQQKQERKEEENKEEERRPTKKKKTKRSKSQSNSKKKKKKSKSENASENEIEEEDIKSEVPQDKINTLKLKPNEKKKGGNLSKTTENINTGQFNFTNKKKFSDILDEFIASNKPKVDDEDAKTVNKEKAKYKTIDILRRAYLIAAGNNGLKIDKIRDFMATPLDEIKKKYNLSKNQLDSIHEDGYNLRKELNKSHRTQNYFPLLPASENKKITSAIDDQNWGNFYGRDKDAQSDEDFDENDVLGEIQEIEEEDNKSN